MEAVLVTLDRDGMALVRADGRSELVPTRPRQVYDITGAGDMVLSVVGLCLAGGADYDEAAALGNVAGGLEVEKIGVALLSRAGDPPRPDRPPSARGLGKLLDRDAPARRGPPPPPGRPEDRLHQRLLRPAARRPRPPAPPGRRAGRLPGRRPQLRRQRPPPQGAEPAAQPPRTPAPRCWRRWKRVDAVTVFDEDTPLDLIEAILPDVLVKGGDYRPEEVVGRDEVEAAGGRLVLIPLVEGHSTTGLVHRAAERDLTAHAAETVPAPHVAARAVRPTGVNRP